MWDESYTRDIAVLETLLMQDEEDAKSGQGQAILQTLQQELEQADDLEGMDEIVSTIENFINAYQKQS